MSTNKAAGKKTAAKRAAVKKPVPQKAVAKRPSSAGASTLDMIRSLREDAERLSLNADQLLSRVRGL